MTVNYTTLLGLAKPVTGTEAGTWGDIVNDEITTLLEDSVAATATVDVTAGGVTLTDLDGQQDQARCAVIRVIGTPGTARAVVAPNRSKAYIVINESDGAVTIKASATTGVSVAASTKALVVWNGSDYTDVARSVLTGAVTAVTATSPVNSTGGTTPVISLSTVPTTLGGTNLTSYTAGDILYASGANTLAKLAIGSTGEILTVSSLGFPEWASGGGGGGGTVSSVGFSGPNNSVFPISGSPVTSSGTLSMGYSGAAGSVLYASATNTIANLLIGSTGQVLTVSSSGLPQWSSGLNPTTSGIAFWTGSGWGSSYTTTGSGTTLALAVSPSFTNPQLGTPSSGTLTNCTGLPLNTGISGTLGASNGGTGQNGYTTGDILYASGSSSLARLAIGSSGQVLTVSSGVPVWSTSSGGGVTRIPAQALSGNLVVITGIPAGVKIITLVLNQVSTSNSGNILCGLGTSNGFTGSYSGTVTTAGGSSTFWGAAASAASITNSNSSANTYSGFVQFLNSVPSGGANSWSITSSLGGVIAGSTYRESAGEVSLDTAAVNQIFLSITSSGTFDQGSVTVLYQS